jgi:hypothetical protein
MSGIKNKTNLSADESLKIENLTLICSHHLLFLVIHQLTGFEGGSRHVDSENRLSVESWFMLNVATNYCY